MIVADQRGQTVATEVHDAERVFGPKSNTEYHATHSLERLEEQGHGRALRRNLARTGRLIEQLKSWDVLRAAACLGSSILRDKKSGVYFPEVTWESAHGTPVRHWLRLRKPLRGLDKPPSAVRFVTGTCLFGRSAVAHLADGSQRPLVSTRQLLPSPITKLSFCNDLSLYELDTAYRLGGVISDMIGECRPARCVYLHIPRPEYVLVMLGHQRGHGSGEVMKEWLAAVDRRSKRMGQLFKLLLETRSEVQVDVGSPLDNVMMPYLREAVTAGRTPSPRELADVIHHSHTDVGELFKHWLASRTEDGNVDYYGLAQFSYVAGVVLNMDDDALTIEVDNPSEEPIFKAVSQVIRRTDKQARSWKGNVMAVYPYEQMASWHERSVDWRRVTKNAVEGDVVGAIMAQYGIDVDQRDGVRGM
jgi:hypothetical protein